MALDFAAMLRAARQQEMAPPPPVAPEPVARAAEAQCAEELAAYIARPFSPAPFQLPRELSSYRIPAPVPQIMYIPDFIGASEEAAMLIEANAAPPFKWTRLSARRLQNWGGWPRNGCLQDVEPLPPWLLAVSTVCSVLHFCLLFVAVGRPCLELCPTG